MISLNMLSQTTSGPGSFSTYVTSMGESRDMFGFNVTLYAVICRIFSTNITHRNTLLANGSFKTCIGKPRHSLVHASEYSKTSLDVQYTAVYSVPGWKG